MLVSGEVYPELGESVAESLGLQLAPIEFKRHPNGELYVRYEDSVRGKDVFIIQAHATHNGLTAEEAVNQHRYLVRAAFGSDARSIAVIAPYLAHSRGDRKARGREVVPIADVIEGFEIAQANRMISVDLHSPQTQTIFRGGPFDHLTAQPLLRHRIRQDITPETQDEYVVVAPDAGAVKNNNYHSRELDLDIVYMNKERERENSTQLIADARLIGGVANKRCVIFDDMIDGGGTIVAAAERLKESGAKEISVAATHPVLSGSAVERLDDSPIDTIYLADTLPIEAAKEILKDRLQIVRVGPMIGRAIFEILTPDGSISSLFHDQNHM